MFVWLSLQSTADDGCDPISDQTRAFFFRWCAATLPEHQVTGSSFLTTRIFSHRFFHLRSSWQNQFLQLTPKTWYKCGRTEKIGFQIMKNPFYQDSSTATSFTITQCRGALTIQTQLHTLAHSFIQSVVFERSHLVVLFIHFINVIMQVCYLNLIRIKAKKQIMSNWDRKRNEDEEKWKEKKNTACVRAMNTKKSHTKQHDQQ